MPNDAIIVKIDLFDDEFYTINESMIIVQICNGDRTVQLSNIFGLCCKLKRIAESCSLSESDKE